MKLSNIKELGRYINTETGKEYSLKKGTNKQRGTDHVFYLYRGRKQIISDLDYFSKYKKLRKHIQRRIL